MNLSPDNNMQRSGNSFYAFIRNLVSFWPLIFIAVVMALTAAWLYLRYTIPLYESNATILIKDPNKGIEESKLFTTLDRFASKKIVDNEIELLRSRKVMHDVVKNLRLYAPVYQDNKPYPILASELSPVLVELKMPDYLSEKDRIYFSYYTNKHLVMQGSNVYPVNVWVNSPWGMIRFIPNNRYKPSSATPRDLFFSLVSVKKMASHFLDELEVGTSSKAATIVYLRLVDRDPDRAEDILDELIRVYNATTIKSKNTFASNALSFVEKRIHYYVRELDSMEKAIQNFKSDQGIVDMSVQGKLFLGSVEANDEKISDLNVKLAVLDQVESYMLARSGFPQPQTNAIPEGSRELNNYSKRDTGELSKVSRQLQNINSEIEKLPAVPVVNSYKNLQIINLTSHNRALARDSANPEVRAEIEANIAKIIELQKQVTSEADSADINDKRRELLGQRKELEAYLSSILSRESSDRPMARAAADPGRHGVLVPAIGRLDDGILSELLQKFNDLEIQYERLRKTTAENNPVIASLQDQIEKMKPDILENIRLQRSAIEAEKANVTGTAGEYGSIMKTIPEKERALIEITRQQSVKNNIYNFLLQKREEAALSFAFAVADSRLVDHAEAGRTPVSPHKRLVYSVALFLSLGFVIAFIFLREVVNPGVKFRNDIQAITSFPIIGDISYAGSKRALVTAEGEQTYVAEQFRQIRTTLLHQGAKKKILVTSSITGEGKSFIASNIALSIALTEKRVLLIELDLHKPKLGRIFESAESPGMSEYLSAKAAADMIIKQTSINPNLYLIPAGDIPVNPSELLLQDRLGALLNKLDTQFDYIIMETAPVNAVTDAYILSKYAEAILYVVRQGKTKKADLKKMEESLKMQGLGNAVIIFNGVRPDAFSVPAYPYHSLSQER